ncbi:hypothetical protein ACH4U5_03615 [Streptomyces sp. NPDC020858]|uniref:hypothetical protein n=1 Tax=Streptomyces sp. NPDC020858 TaxID=3365097 RepID=UPI0037B30E73
MRGEGVVLYAEAPQDGRSWRYAVIVGDVDGVREQEGPSGRSPGIRRLVTSVSPGPFSTLRPAGHQVRSDAGDAVYEAGGAKPGRRRA